MKSRSLDQDGSAWEIEWGSVDVDSAVAKYGGFKSMQSTGRRVTLREPHWNQMKTLDVYLAPTSVHRIAVVKLRQVSMRWEKKDEIHPFLAQVDCPDVLARAAGEEGDPLRHAMGEVRGHA